MSYKELAAKLVKKQDADTMTPSYFFDERFFDAYQY